MKMEKEGEKYERNEIKMDKERDSCMGKRRGKEREKMEKEEEDSNRGKIRGRKAREKLKKKRKF